MEEEDKHMNIAIYILSKLMAFVYVCYNLLPDN